MNWETEHYNSVLEINVLFLGIFTWEPDIYIGFSSALHLQCGGQNCQICHQRAGRNGFNKAVRGLRQAIKLADGGVTEKIG
jgi:hypothetical protein